MEQPVGIKYKENCKDVIRICISCLHSMLSSINKMLIVEIMALILEKISKNVLENSKGDNIGFKGTVADEI